MEGWFETSALNEPHKGWALAARGPNVAATRFSVARGNIQEK